MNGQSGIIDAASEIQHPVKGMKPANIVMYKKWP